MSVCDGPIRIIANDVTRMRASWNADGSTR